MFCSIDGHDDLIDMPFVAELVVRAAVARSGFLADGE
jgi:hypothetical protein